MCFHLLSMLLIVKSSRTLKREITLNEAKIYNQR